MIEYHGLDKYLSKKCDDVEKDIEAINSHLKLMETILNEDG